MVVPSGMVVATMAAMCGLLETGTLAEGRQRAEDMARASCLVPSLMATPVEEQATAALRILVEWATLETKRPYPLDTIGRGVGRDKATSTLMGLGVALPWYLGLSSSVVFISGVLVLKF